MDQDPDIERLLALLHRVPRPPEEVIEGASAEELARLKQSLGREIPAQLREWLEVCNGTAAGPGGIFGTGTSRDFLNIEFYLDLYPAWRELNWVPVGSDGVGNYYVLDAGERGATFTPVYFIDVMDNQSQPSYCVASNLFHYLEFLMESELGMKG